MKEKEILAKSKNIKELELNCALWTSEILDEFKFKPVPLPPFKNKENLSAYELANAIRNNSFQEEQVMYRYCEMKRKIQVENSAIYDWLKHCIFVLQKEGHIKEAQKIQEYIQDVPIEILWVPPKSEEKLEAAINDY